MEGEMCPLDQIVRIKNKYKAYLFVDEAHSIGAIGHHGRGICELKGVDPNQIDVLMGTFTKSFGSVGGYLAGSNSLINWIRTQSAGSLYSTSMTPAATEQINQALLIMLGRDGTTLGQRKLNALRVNANYFRNKCKLMGLHVLGEEDSPVVPIMLYNPSKILSFSVECLKRGLAVAVVSFPATPVLLARSRICISAAHTRPDLDQALKKIGEVAELIGITYNRENDSLFSTFRCDAEHTSKQFQSIISNPSHFQVWSALISGSRTLQMLLMGIILGIVSLQQW